MKQCFAYVRVSTPKQKEFGVSPEAQKEAIVRYAEQHDIAIVQWFEEVKTAAKTGRREFTKMLTLLKLGKVDGVVIHKIDRSARNLRDWVTLGELIDAGVTVYFANENLDLHTRGGRLSADIQAVVAADFIRNLSEETRKGFLGRLRQGIYPLGAPLGYRNHGKGKAKTIERVRGPLVRLTFELYDSGRYNLLELSDEMHRRGLRNRRNGTVTRNGLSTILNNPFYCGLIRIQKWGETFTGVHAPLIPVSLYKRVQDRLKGRMHTKAVRHRFIYSRLISCESCGEKLRGERQKGNVYYRCHTASCPTKCIREEVIDTAVGEAFRSCRLSDMDRHYLVERLRNRAESFQEEREKERQALKLSLGQLEVRLGRLIDAFVDGSLDKELFDHRKASLLLEKQELQERLKATGADEGPGATRAAKMVELGNSLWLSYGKHDREGKREVLEFATSNRKVIGKNVVVELSKPFSLLANHDSIPACDPQRAIRRTETDQILSDHKALDHVIDKLLAWAGAQPAA